MSNISKDEIMLIMKNDLTFSYTKYYNPSTRQQLKVHNTSVEKGNFVGI